jgi:hypothetical protein
MGVGASYADLNWFGKFFVNTVIKKPIADKTIQEQLIEDELKQIDWTIVRPGGLTNGKPLGIYRAGEGISGGRPIRRFGNVAVSFGINTAAFSGMDEST